MSLGKRLRIERERNGWSQLYVAEKLGITNTVLSNYERDYRDPDTETLKKLADLYEVSADYLLGRSEYSAQTTTDPLDDPSRNIQFNGWDKLSPEDQEEIKAFFRAKIMIREAEERDRRNKNN
ncbi:helix-turn-helix domain-containing protein [Paenibacillus sp. S-38]|uniref:helix-turn-helix domain-containing protein n=1 Tax=Paenibacillus sp. S-38 TaxID=3416710 RepID=UPI003CEA0996